MTAAALAGQTPLREVRLYGHLGQRFGRSHRLAVESPAEAARALAVLHPGFGPALVGHEPGVRVLVGRGARRHELAEDEVHCGVGGADLIRIVPVVAGAKKGWGQIVAGIALMWFAPWAAGLAWGTAGAGAAISAASVGVAVGKALVLGGIVQLVSPQPRGSSAVANEPSYSLSGAVNTSGSGGPVPLIFGRVVCGSVTVSAGLSTDDLVAPPNSSLPNAPLRPPYEPPGPGLLLEPY